MATLIDYILIPLDHLTIVHAHALCIDTIPSDREVSTCNQSRWPSNKLHWFPWSPRYEKLVYLVRQFGWNRKLKPSHAHANLAIRYIATHCGPSWPMLQLVIYLTDEMVNLHASELHSPHRQTVAGLAITAATLKHILQLKAGPPPPLIWVFGHFWLFCTMV